MKKVNFNYERISIFGIRMLNITMTNALALIEDRINAKQKTSIFFVNADCLNKVFVDKDYYQILSGNEVVFPDGIGIKLAGKMLKTPVIDNVNGTDMLPLLCAIAQKKGYRIFLLGAAPGIADTMKENLEKKYPGLQICGTRNGFFNWDAEAKEVIEEINSAKTDILLVAFGAPLQEMFISRFGSGINAFAMMGVGGLFDFYSGRIPRAPLWMRKLGCEWIFRLLQEPKRMWKRYIIGNPLFLYRVFRWKQTKNV